MSSRSLRRNRRAAAAGALAATLGFAGLGLAASPAQALPGFEFERLAGTDRILTAVDISENTFDSADTVLLARADLFPDALAGNYLAGAESAPILLSHTDDVPQETLDEIERLGATNVTLLGGTSALSADVQAELEAAGLTVGREAGTDRYKTAAEIATSQDAAGIGEVDGARTAILATGERFPDALTGGPLAYAGSHPLLLTPTATLGADAAGALEALEIEHVLILGGTAAVSEAAEASVEAMGITTERLDGATRYSTATEIAEWALANAGFSDEHINVATGRNFPDALTGGPHSGEEVTPIILANDGNTAEAIAYIEDHANTLVDGHIFGGTAAVSQAVEDALEAAAQAGGNQTFAITPGEAAENTVSATGTNTGARQYTISGLEAGTYDIALFSATNVKNTNGVISFVDTPSDNIADLTIDGTGAVIEVVNGGAVGTPDNHVEVSPVNGTISFTVDSETPDAVVPVIWVETTDADNLNLDASDKPTEPFGLGGLKSFVPAEAATGAISATGAVTADEDIASVDKNTDRIVTNDGTYFYDANDTFFLGSGVDGADVDETADNCSAATQVTLAQFEAELSAGDELDGSTFYQANAELPSSFCLEDIAPVAPGATVLSKTDTTVTFTVTGVATGATVSVYCGPDNDGAFSKTTDVLRGQTTTDQNAAAGFQVVATGLTAGTAYDCFVTQTVAGEESGASTRVDVSTNATPTDTTAPTITDARRTTDANLQGIVDTGDVWTLTFSEDMNASTAAGQFVLEDVDGDRFTVDCGLVVAANDDLTSATCALGPDASANADRVLTITLGEVADDTNAAGDGVAEYPVTIVTTDAQIRDEATNVVNVAGSADRVIDLEA